MMEYFALKESVDFVKDMMGNIAGWNQSVGMYNNNLAEVWARNIRYYYSNIFYGSGADSSLEFAGKQGELIKMLVPQARTLNQQLLSLVTKQKLAFTPQSRTTDQTTLSDTKVAKGLCDETVDKQRLDALSNKAAELCTLTGSAYYGLCWDPLKGKPMGVDQQNRLLYEGDLDIDVYSVYDVQFNFFIENFGKVDITVLRKVRNRWDLIAKYPDLASKLEKIPAISKAQSYDLFWYNNMSDDYIFEYHAMHKSTCALPEGRYAVFCDENTIMFDDHNPYEKENGERYIPMVQMRPETIAGTAFGYPIFSNILPLQEMSDFAFSAAASNNAAFGVQSILNPIGNDIGVSNIGGLNFINYRPLADGSNGKPEALNLTKSSPELYKFLELCRSYQMEIYNISGALRGQPPAGVTSGTAIATLSTNAIEFIQGFSKAHIQALEQVMDMSLWIYKVFAKQPRLLEIVGDTNESTVTEFVGSQLSNISRVKLRVSNPLLATAAGSLEVATQLLNQGLIKDPEHYFQILEGAPPEVMYEEKYDQTALINKENDIMRKGQNPPVLITDRHAIHVRSHLSLLDDPMVRGNPQLMQSIMAHNAEHITQAMKLQANPILMSIIETGQIPVVPQLGPAGTGMPGGPQMPVSHPATGGGQGPGQRGQPAQPAKPGPTQAPAVVNPNREQGQ